MMQLFTIEYGESDAAYTVVADKEPTQVQAYMFISNQKYANIHPEDLIVIKPLKTYTIDGNVNYSEFTVKPINKRKG